MTRLSGWQVVTVLGMIFGTIVTMAIMHVDLTAMISLAALIIGGGAFAAAQGAKENTNGSLSQLVQVNRELAHRLGDATPPTAGTAAPPDTTPANPS